MSFGGGKAGKAGPSLWRMTWPVGGGGRSQTPAGLLCAWGQKRLPCGLGLWKVPCLAWELLHTPTRVSVGLCFNPFALFFPVWSLRRQLPGSAVLPLLSSRPGTALTGGAGNWHGGPPALPGGLCPRDPSRSRSATSGRRPYGALGCEVPGRISGSLIEARRAHTNESPTAGPECPG